VRLTNLILGDVVDDKKDPTNAVTLAFKELEDNMENVLVTAGDFELQAGLVELIFRLIPHEVRQEKAQAYFSTNTVAQAFSDINSPEFEAGCRVFLNTLNESLKEKQSVTSFPCCSAYFGKEKVYQPMDPKIPYFWVDFNLGSKSISLFVEEKDEEGNYKEDTSWETVLIKAENVEDYRLKGNNKDALALFLRLKLAASELVTFLPHDSSHYVQFSFSGDYLSSLQYVLEKILGRPNIQNNSGDSDVSSTPSKASVAINPVHIRSKNTEISYVMPTASIMLQLSESTTDNEEEKAKLQKKATRNDNKNQRSHDTGVFENKETKGLTTDEDKAEHEPDQRVGGNVDDIQTVPEDASKRRKMSTGPGRRKEEESHKGTSHVETKKTPVKRTSKRLQSKMQSDQHPRKSGNPKDDNNSNSDSSEKSYPSVFNVRSRLAASKRKSMPTKTLSDAAKSRKAIREKVFAKAGRSLSLLEKPEETNIKLHMVTPARRRVPRSGEARDRDEDNQEEEFDIIEDSLPIADSLEGESGPKQQYKRDGDKEAVSKKRKVKESRQRKEPVLESAPIDRKRTKSQTEKSQERQSAGSKRATNKGVSQSVKGKRQTLGKTMDVPDPDVGNNECEDVHENQDEPVLEGSKRRATNKGALQRARGKHQKVGESLRMDEPEVGNNECEDVHENQNEPDLEELKRRPSSKRTSQSVKEKHQKPLHVNEPEVGNYEYDDDYENEEVYDGSDDEVTECYVEEASPLINSPPVAKAGNRARRQSPVTKDPSVRHRSLDMSPTEGKPKEKRPAKERSKADDSIIRRNALRTHQYEHEFGLNREKTPQAQQPGAESDEYSEEEDQEQFQSIAIDQTPRHVSQQSEADNASEQEEEKDDTEEEFDDELDYDFNVNITPRYKTNQTRQDRRVHGLSSGGLNPVKRSMLLNDSGIGETPFAEDTRKRSKSHRKRSWKPLQVSITKTPITPRSGQEEQDADEDISIGAETDEESFLYHGSLEQQTVDKRQRGKRKFVDWSTSGPSRFHDPSHSGAIPLGTEGSWYKKPLHVSEAHQLSYRSQHFAKPRKLSYDDKPYDIQEAEEVITDASEGEIRNEVQGLMNIAGSEVFKSVRKKRHMIKSFLQRTTDVMLSSMDTFWNEQRAASFNAMKSYKSQMTDQIQNLEEDWNKTAVAIRQMEDTIVSINTYVPLN